MLPDNDRETRPPTLNVHHRLPLGNSPQTAHRNTPRGMQPEERDATNSIPCEDTWVSKRGEEDATAALALHGNGRHKEENAKEPNKECTARDIHQSKSPSEGDDGMVRRSEHCHWHTPDEHGLGLGAGGQ